MSAPNLMFNQWAGIVGTDAASFNASGGEIGCGANLVSPSDVVRPDDCQRIGLLDGPEVAGGRADIAVSEHRLNTAQIGTVHE